MTLKIPAALVAAFLLAGCATSPPPPEEATKCAGPEWEWETYRARIVSRVQSMAWVELSDAERYLLITRMNLASSPRTAFAFDKVGFFKHPATHGVLLVYLVGDCVWLEQLTTEFAVYMTIIYGKGT